MDIVEVHGFCDSSIEAYGARVHIRSPESRSDW